MVITKRTRGWVLGCALACAALSPAIANAAEVVAETPVEWQVQVAKALAAGLAMGLSALGAGYAQGKIGSAGAGALAERPEISTWILLLEALPEIIVLLGFVSAILITR